jgi:hypothetical protein
LSDSKRQNFFESLCRQILGTDSSIRFAGIANKFGRLVASKYRVNLVPLMNKEETEQYAIQAVTRSLLRETFESKIGKLRFSVSYYEELIRATIPCLTGEENRDFYVLVSFDVGSDAVSVIGKKIIQIIKQ